MIPLRLKPEPSSEYPADVYLLQDTLAREGYSAPLADIERAWKKISDNSCAGWLMVNSYSHEERVDRLLRHLVPDEEGCDNCGR